MNSNFKKIFIVFSIIILIVVVASCTKKTKNINVNPVEVGENVETNNLVNDSDSNKNSEGRYIDYNGTDISSIEDNIVLFFHASWCPSCKTADKKIKLDTIPDGLTILKVDYDTETELKKKYGVTTQHTFVQVDSSGEMINKWLGSRDVSEITEKVKEL